MDHVTVIQVKVVAEVDGLNSDLLNSAPSSSCSAPLCSCGRRHSAHTDTTLALFPLCSQHTGAILRLDEIVWCPVIFTSDESVFIKPQEPRVDAWIQTKK